MSLEGATWVLATRKSPLALAQAKQAVTYLRALRPDWDFEILTIVTTGDRHPQWSLEQKGGEGLFIKELERALQEGRAHLAVHSAKDLPVKLTQGLSIAGYLDREKAHDVCVMRKDLKKALGFIGTGSPRRRLQVKLFYPQAVWSEIRGNIDTRLDRVRNGDLDAVILALAGLRRLGLDQGADLELKRFSLEQVVPAAGQGAIALQCRDEDVATFVPLLDRETDLAVSLERAVLRELGGGCHVATGVHYVGGQLFFFHEGIGFKTAQVRVKNETDIADIVHNCLQEWRRP